MSIPATSIFLNTDYESTTPEDQGVEGLFYNQDDEGEKHNADDKVAENPVKPSETPNQNNDDKGDIDPEKGDQDKTAVDDKDKTDKVEVEDKSATDWEIEDNPYKKRYQDSQREVNKVLLPQAKLAKELTEKMAKVTPLLSDPEVAALLKEKGFDPNGFVKDVEVTQAVAKDKIEASQQELSAEQQAQNRKAVEDFIKNEEPTATYDEIVELEPVIQSLMESRRIPLKEAIRRAHDVAYPDRAEKKISARIAAQNRQNELAQSRSSSGSGETVVKKTTTTYTPEQEKFAAVLGVKLS
jgi:hypothetical protein